MGIIVVSYRNNKCAIGSILVQRVSLLPFKSNIQLIRTPPTILISSCCGVRIPQIYNKYSFIVKPTTINNGCRMQLL